MVQCAHGDGMWEGMSIYNIKKGSNDITPLIVRNVKKKSGLKGFLWIMAAAFTESHDIPSFGQTE